jgi:hypothetical protein
MQPRADSCVCVPTLLGELKDGDAWATKIKTPI